MAVTNLLLNPSAEGSFTNTITNRASPTVTQDTTWAHSGTKSVKFVTPGLAAQEGISFLTATGLGLTGTARSFVGNVYVTSPDTGTGGIAVNVVIIYTDSSAVVTPGPTATLTGSEMRLLVPAFTIDATKTVNQFRLDVRTNGVVAKTFYADAAMLHEGTEAVDYFDGDSLNATWNGTAHGSSSTRVDYSFIDVIPANGTRSDAPVLTVT